MLNVLFIVAGALVLFLLVVLIIAAAKPPAFRVERATAIHAAPDKIFALINDFHMWNMWSPYEKLDPAMKKTFSGATAGPGSIYEWDGNNKAGKGRMEITGTTPPDNIVIKLDFYRPFEGHHIAEFTLQPSGETTNVTWAMHGPANFMFKLMGIFIDMDNLVGKDFAAGLANLKNIAEK